MTANDYVSLAVATVMAVLTAIRTPSALQGRNVPLWSAHVLVTVCVLLAVTPIYLAVDAWLGGTNLANLCSRLMVGVVFLAGVRHVARGIVHEDIERRLTAGPGITVLIAGSALTTFFFALADTPTSSMGLNAYQDDPWVVAYRAGSFIYPAYCSVVLAPVLYRDARVVHDPRLHKLSKGFLAAGFACVPAVLVFTVLEYAHHSARIGADFFVYAGILLAAAGPLIAFTARRLRDQERIKLTT